MTIWTSCNGGMWHFGGSRTRPLRRRKKKNPKLTGEEYQAAKDQVLLDNGFTPEDIKRYRRGCGDLVPKQANPEGFAWVF